MTLKENLEKKLEAIRNKMGYCTLMPRHYDFVHGVRRNLALNGNTDKEVKVHFILEPSSWGGGEVVRFLDGVTGCEAYNLHDLAAEPLFGDFCICAGTKGRWDSLKIDGTELIAKLCYNCPNLQKAFFANMTEQDQRLVLARIRSIRDYGKE